jgi:integrating conjugative element protein (TIGR03746 family)
MSRFKNEVAHLQAHVKTLRLAGAALFVVALLLGFGWWSAPKSLTIHVPPDLRSGSTRKWWDVPPESVYAFTFYIWQQAQRWPTMAAKTTRATCMRCRLPHAELPGLPAAGLRIPAQQRRAAPARARHLRDSRPRLRRRSGHARRTVSDRDWIVTLDVSADEYYGAEQVKRALVRYPIKVVRMDIDPERNPFGLALDCYARAPQRIEPPSGAARRARQRPRPPAGDTP